MRPWWLSSTPANRPFEGRRPGEMPAFGMLLGTVLLLFQAAFPFFGAHARSSLELTDSVPLPVENSSC